MSKVIYLHIGPPKTGSTSIQTYFDKNSERLKSLGILYPAKGRLQKGEKYRVHRSGGIALETGPSHMHNMLSWSAEDKVEGLTHAELWPPVLQEIENTDCTRVVISGEGFFHLPRARVNLVKDYLAGYDVRIVFYQRNLFARAKSMYGQMIKAGKIYMSFETFLKERYPEMVAYHDTKLEDWSRIFGAENVILKNFEDLAKRKYFVQDFLLTIGVDEENLPQSDRVDNVSMSPAVLRETRFINRLQLNTVGKGGPHPLFSRVRIFIRKKIFQNTVGLLFKPFLSNPVVTAEHKKIMEDELRKAGHAFSLQQD